MRNYLRTLSLCHPAERWLMICARISWQPASSIVW